MGGTDLATLSVRYPGILRSSATTLKRSHEMLANESSAYSTMDNALKNSFFGVSYSTPAVASLQEADGLARLPAVVYLVDDDEPPTCPSIVVIVVNDDEIVRRGNPLRRRVVKGIP